MSAAKSVATSKISHSPLRRASSSRHTPAMTKLVERYLPQFHIMPIGVDV